MGTTKTKRFCIDALGIDGASIGKAFQEQNKLSLKWLAIITEHLKTQGAVFDTGLSGPLAHIRIKFTSANSAALITLSVHDKPAASVLLFSGESPETEQALGKMFVQSMRRSFPLNATGGKADAFEQVLSEKDRPLMVVVPIPNDNIDESDRELIKEISQHLADAFLVRAKP
jgi:hypothetical protein